MVLLYILVITMVSAALGNPPPLDQYLFYHFLPITSQLNVIDAIPITNASTIPTSNKLPTLTQIKYYNYYAASVNYFYDLENLTCAYCLKIKPHIANHTVLFNGTHDTLSMVALSHSREEIVVSFRGTANSWNLLLDFALFFNVSPKDNSNIKVHLGFYIATMSLYQRVVQAIAVYKVNNPKYKIVIAGLSLGAAMARVTSFFLQDTNQFPNTCYELYTFGEFRVGNKPFAEYMNSLDMTSARVVHRADIIPHFPPVTLLGTDLLYDCYIHAQTEYWIYGPDEKNEQRFCSQNVYEDATCSNSIGPTYSFDDHLKYFDVNIASAFAQPLQLGSIAFNILPVETYIPPLPKFIENPLGKLLDATLDVPLPVFGDDAFGHLFREASNVTNVDLSENKLTEILSHIFFNVRQLKFINEVSRVDSVAFYGATDLITLDLSHNHIKLLDSPTFSFLSNLLT